MPYFWRGFRKGFIAGSVFGLILIALYLLLFPKPVDAECRVSLPLGHYTGDLDTLVDGFCYNGYFTPGLLTRSFYWSPTPPESRDARLIPERRRD